MFKHNRISVRYQHNDPFAQGGGGAPSIFDQANQRQQQANSTMPEGMPNQPPRRATDPSRNQQSQQRQQFEQSGGTGQERDPNDSIVNQNGNDGGNEGGSLLDKYRTVSDNGQQSSGGNQPQQQSSTGGNNGGQGGQQSNGSQSNGNNQQTQDYFNLGAEHYTNAFGQRNFLDGVDKEKISAALEGDADAFTEVINAAVRNGATSSSFLSQQVAKRGSQGLLDGFRSELPKHVRDQQINDMWNGNKASLMKDPAMRPVAEAVLQQVRSRNPNATAAEINEEAEQYMREAFGAIGSNFADSQSEESNEQQSKGQDMSSLFDFG